MRNGLFRLLVCATLVSVGGCAASTSPNAAGAGVSTDAAGDAGSGTAGSGGSGGSPTQHSASVTAQADNGSSQQVSVSQPAQQADVEASVNKVGAVSVGSQLVLWMADVGADGSAKVLEIHIDTAKNPLPASNIAVGKVDADVWVSYTVSGPSGAGIYLSSGKGTIDVTTCPSKGGTAAVGKLNSVVVSAEGGAVGPSSVTLNGTFSLAFFGQDGDLTCKPSQTGGGGSVDTGGLKPSAASTCNADPCDGGSNTTRNCCPYVPCMSPCIATCADTVNGCVQGCMADPFNAMACVQQCFKQLVTCETACLDKCNVSASCKVAANAYFGCQDKNADACMQAEDSDACIDDKCCGELKAAF